MPAGHKRDRDASDGGSPGREARTAVWLDCDPGHDDAMAIILAGHSPSLQVLGISTVVGNQTVEKVTNNALRMLRAAGLEHIDVVQGAHKPLMRGAPLCPEIHGESGLSPTRAQPQQQPGAARAEGHPVPHPAEEDPAEAALPPPRKAPLEDKAPIAMFRAIHRSFRDGGRRCKLICTGSLTNVALLVSLYPEVADMAEVVLMGGAMGVGNTGPVMEFNIQTDPEAASIVFQAGWPVAMVPIEVTHTALVTPDVLRRIQQRDTPFCSIICRLLLFFRETYKEVFQFEDPPLHDPCAVAYCLHPEIFTVKRMRVDIETKSDLSAGQTVCDIWGQSQQPKNVDVATSMGVPAFWDLMISALHRADDASCMNKPV
eukprot:jgi/Tetstr1/420445/TSEL_011558.t1